MDGDVVLVGGGAVYMLSFTAWMVGTLHHASSVASKVWHPVKRMASNLLMEDDDLGSWSPLLCILDAEITDLMCHAQLLILELQLRVSGTPSKHSVHRATDPSFFFFSSSLTGIKGSYPSLFYQIFQETEIRLGGEKDLFQAVHRDFFFFFWSQISFLG